MNAKDPKRLYQEAYDLQYSEHDFKKAVGLYRDIIEYFPESKQAGFAKAQIDRIKSMMEELPGESTDELERLTKLSKAEDDEVTVDAKFTALKTIPTFLKIAAGIIVIAGVGEAINAGINSNFERSAVVAASSVLFAFFPWTLAEVVRVVPAIEENTRKIAKLLEENQRW